MPAEHWHVRGGVSPFREHHRSACLTKCSAKRRQALVRCCGMQEGLCICSSHGGGRGRALRPSMPDCRSAGSATSVCARRAHFIMCAHSCNTARPSQRWRGCQRLRCDARPLRIVLESAPAFPSSSASALASLSVLLQRLLKTFGECVPCLCTIHACVVIRHCSSTAEQTWAGGPSMGLAQPLAITQSEHFNKSRAACRAGHAQRARACTYEASRRPGCAPAAGSSASCGDEAKCRAGPWGTGASSTTWSSVTRSTPAPAAAQALGVPRGGGTRKPCGLRSALAGVH